MIFLTFDLLWPWWLELTINEIKKLDAKCFKILSKFNIEFNKEYEKQYLTFIGYTTRVLSSAKEKVIICFFFFVNVFPFYG